jgi:hypothetical protein
VLYNQRPWEVGGDPGGRRRRQYCAPGHPVTVFATAYGRTVGELRACELECVETLIEHSWAGDVVGA